MKPVGRGRERGIEECNSLFFRQYVGHNPFKNWFPGNSNITILYVNIKKTRLLIYPLLLVFSCGLA